MAKKITQARLKRCPFCHSHNLDLHCNEVVDWIACLACGASGPNGNTATQAMLFWNHGASKFAALAPEPAGGSLASRNQLAKVDLT